MGNIINNNTHNLKIKINYDEYWDFFVNKDSFLPYLFYSNDLYDKCLISYIDINNEKCIDGEWLYGLDKYKWEYSNSTNHILYNIGYTGVDNGLIRYRKDRISNEEFLKIYTKSKYKIKASENCLKLHQVSGNTLLYEYPTKIEDKKLKLNGGFYQGFFETKCEDYKVLPTVIDDEWNFEFVLKKEEFIKESNKTLNDKYPENKGIFFYIGTRAENKWIYLYDKEEECDDLSPDNFVEDAKINRKDYIIGNFYNPNPDFNGFDRFNIDDYISFKYYSEKVYTDAIDNTYFRIEDYIELDEKPPIIDEEANIYVTLGCCKTSNVNNNEISIISNSKSCGCWKQNNINDEKVYEGCLSFGEDYIDNFDGLDDGTDYIASELDISDFEYETKEGFNLKFANQYKIDTDNKFLLFDRTCDGFTVENWKEGSIMSYHGVKSQFNGNLFLLMNRTRTGYTVENIDELRKQYDNKYNIYKDIYNNALAFQITDDGEIGYRYMVLDCEVEHEVKIAKAFSNKNIVKENEWSVINIKIKALPKTMVIYFYVNSKLVFISRELPKIDLRKLYELDEKQEGVPYNISLGGGSQGLSETILPNYMLLPYKVYPIEKYFAGTFIGYMKSFKFYNCKMEYTTILNNFKFEINRID